MHLWHLAIVHSTLHEYPNHVSKYLFYVFYVHLRLSRFAFPIIRWLTRSIANIILVISNICKVKITVSKSYNWIVCATCVTRKAEFSKRYKSAFRYLTKFWLWIKLQLCYFRAERCNCFLQSLLFAPLLFHSLAKTNCSVSLVNNSFN